MSKIKGLSPELAQAIDLLVDCTGFALVVEVPTEDGPTHQLVYSNFAQAHGLLHIGQDQWETDFEASGEEADGMDPEDY